MPTLTKIRFEKPAGIVSKDWLLSAASSASFNAHKEEFSRYKSFIVENSPTSGEEFSFIGWPLNDILHKVVFESARAFVTGCVLHPKISFSENEKGIRVVTEYNDEKSYRLTREHLLRNSKDKDNLIQMMYSFYSTLGRVEAVLTHEESNDHFTASVVRIIVDHRGGEPTFFEKVIFESLFPKDYFELFQNIFDIKAIDNERATYSLFRTLLHKVVNQLGIPKISDSVKSTNFDDFDHVDQLIDDANQTVEISNEEKVLAIIDFFESENNQTVKEAIDFVFNVLFREGFGVSAFFRKILENEVPDVDTNHEVVTHFYNEINGVFAVWDDLPATKQQEITDLIFNSFE